MGCGGSTDKGKQSPPDDSAEISFDRRPKISVRIGEQVKKGTTSTPVIFIFGGPGSHKGRIVDDLVTSYGLHFICCEDLIFQELPKKVANAMKISCVKEIKDLLEEDPEHLTLDWVLHMVERYIDKQGKPKTTYLIDLLPNLKYMLRIDSFVKDVIEPMKKFEARFPVSFALNLAIPPDKVVKAKQNACAKPGAGEKMKETGGQGDEADAGRTQRRAALFDTSVKPFLDYFSESTRLVTVDVTCGVADFIWHRVHQLLCELDWTPNRTVNTVILFTFDENDAHNIDYNKFLIDKINLKTLVDNPSGQVDNLLLTLSRHINNNSKNSDSFVVDLGGTSLCNGTIDTPGKCPIIFVEVNEGYLESYLPGSPKNFKPKAGTRKYKVISTMENEICLFPLNTSDEVCTRISGHMAKDRS